ncbi:MAG TPA: M1 family metallopeptidase [Bryobacteraceae bacterium]|nr:M1 family metallopeptidase [Bryobacteraceae bacterium]
MRLVHLMLCFIVLLAVSCRRTPSNERPKDSHSYSNPELVRVRHVDLDLEAFFDQKTLRGTAVLELERAKDGESAPLILDTRDLRIEGVEGSLDGTDWSPVKFEAGAMDPILGAPLTIHLPAGGKHVRIGYMTSPNATALQWLEPAQTAGKKLPFLYTQSEAIHARSWIPLQDTPGVRVTYSARIRAAKGLRAVMSAEHVETGAEGEFRFRMAQPIPSYLIALAVGDLAFRPLGSRTGVYAEPPVVDAAAREFEDTEKMMQAAEELYGPYRWGRYDLLILPPSFPYGGMENPRLTFTSPTVIAGDKSLVSLVAHELAHSWSGNLVTNATWDHFWLNEGFTVYVEQRIIEKIYGKERAEMEAVLATESLKREMERLEPRDQALQLDLRGRDPDAGSTDVAYVKGALFLRTIERAAGRPAFDAFLRSYFDRFAFRSVTTKDFLDCLAKNLKTNVPVEEWVHKPGLPSGAALPVSDALAKVSDLAGQWAQGMIPSRTIPYAKWSTQERIQFLQALPADPGGRRMQALDQAFGITRSGNAEVLQPWLLMSIRNGYTPASAKLEEFLMRVGRMRYIRPLYEELAKTPEGMERARAIFAKAQGGYHPITATAIEAALQRPNR